MLCLRDAMIICFRPADKTKIGTMFLLSSLKNSQQPFLKQQLLHKRGQRMCDGNVGHTRTTKAIRSDVRRWKTDHLSGNMRTRSPFGGVNDTLTVSQDSSCRRHFQFPPWILLTSCKKSWEIIRCVTRSYVKSVIIVTHVTSNLSELLLSNIWNRFTCKIVAEKHFVVNYSERNYSRCNLTAIFNVLVFYIVKKTLRVGRKR